MNYLTPVPEQAKQALEALRATEILAEEDFIKKCLTDMMGGWVPIETYLRIFPSETATKVHMRVHKGVWRRQMHYAAPQGGGAWINLPAVKLWLLGITGPQCHEEGAHSAEVREAAAPAPIEDDSSGGTRSAG